MDICIRLQNWKDVWIIEQFRKEVCHEQEMFIYLFDTVFVHRWMEYGHDLVDRRDTI